MTILSPSFILLCLFTVSNYFSPEFYFGWQWAVPLFLGVSALVFHLIESFLGKTKFIQFNAPGVLLIITLILFANATFVLSWDFDRSFVIFDDFFKVVVLYFLIANILRTKERFHCYLLVLTVCAFFLAYSVLNYGVWQHKRVTIVGSSLVTTDPNFLALVLTYSLPFVLVGYSMLKWKKNILVVAIYLFIILRMLQGFLITESRGGFLGLVVGCGVAFIFINGLKKKIIIFLLLLPLAVFFAFRYVPIEYYYRMQEILYPEADNTGSAMIRAQSMLTAMGYVIAHPFSSYGLGNHSYMLVRELEGVDPGPDEDVFRGKYIVHNFLLQIGADTGLVPLVVYSSFLLFLVIRTRRIYHDASLPSQHADLAIYAKAMVVAFAVVGSSGLFLPIGYKPYLFYLGGMADALYSQYKTALENISHDEKEPT